MTAFGPTMGFCLGSRSFRGKLLVATSAPTPISRPLAIGVNVAVPTINSRRWNDEAFENMTVSPTRLCSATKVDSPRTTWLADLIA
jgi:hypothetical protein